MLDNETYQQYHRTAYCYALLFNRDVTNMLDYSYKNGIISEEESLNLIYSYITTVDDCILTYSPIVLDNLYTILSKASNQNIHIVNKIKLLVNQANIEQPIYDNFLIFQYTCRNYGIGSFAELSLGELYKFRKHNMPFFYSFEDKIYRALDFDFKLIHSLSEKPIIDACKNNYQFLGSLNYFKYNYPMMFQDKCFLEFSKNILEFHTANKFNVRGGNCLISNCAKQNRKLLKYVKTNLAKLKKQ